MGCCRRNWLPGIARDMRASGRMAFASVTGCRFARRRLSLARRTFAQKKGLQRPAADVRDAARVRIAPVRVGEYDDEARPAAR